MAVDGTKLKANASRHKAMGYERMVRAEAEMKEQIDGLLNRAKAADDLEKNEPELDIPGEIRRREDRLAALTAAKLRLEQRQQEADVARGRSKDDERKPRDKNGKRSEELHRHPGSSACVGWRRFRPSSSSCVWR